MLDKLLSVRIDTRGVSKVSVRHAFEKYDRFGNHISREVVDIPYHPTSASIARINALLNDYPDRVSTTFYAWGEHTTLVADLNRYNKKLG